LRFKDGFDDDQRLPRRQDLPPSPRTLSFVPDLLGTVDSYVVGCFGKHIVSCSSRHRLIIVMSCVVFVVFVVVFVGDRTTTFIAYCSTELRAPKNSTGWGEAHGGVLMGAGIPPVRLPAIMRQQAFCHLPFLRLRYRASKP
jgi:hypothetical protein